MVLQHANTGISVKTLGGEKSRLPTMFLGSYGA